MRRFSLVVIILFVFISVFNLFQEEYFLALLSLFIALLMFLVFLINRTKRKKVYFVGRGWVYPEEYDR